MIWSVEYSNVAERDVLNMHWLAATAVCAAVETFARTGEGRAEFIRAGDPELFALRVRQGSALIRRDRATRTLYVYRVFAAR